MSHAAPWSALLSALAMGLYAGLAPGPVLTLVITQTLRFGRREGLKVSFTPLITDAPIIALSLLVLTRLERSDRLLGGIALAGAAFLVYIAMDCFRGSRPKADDQSVAPRSLLKGVIANALNPHPYVAWITVMGPMTLSAAESGWIWGTAFVAAFYAVMVGSKMLVAVLVSRGGVVLGSRGYRILMIGLGVGILVFAGRFFLDGLARLGWR